VDDERIITTENDDASIAESGLDTGAPKTKRRGKDKSAQTPAPAAAGESPTDAADSAKPKKPGYTSSSLEETRQGRYKYILQEKATEKESKKRRWIWILLIFLLFTILFGSSVWGIMSFVEYNNFRILVDKEGRDYLSLSYTREFLPGSEVLTLDGPEFMSDVTLITLYDRLSEFEAKEGNSTTDSDKFLASTFFLKNVSDKQQNYTEYITLNGVKKDVDSAIRVFLSHETPDGTSQQIFAKPKADGSPEEVVPPDPQWTNGRHFGADGGIGDTPWYAEPFVNDSTVMRNSGLTLEPGEVRRYTIIIWLEGCDPECINDIIGGTVRLQLNFNVE
jgi:hypothetical protein